MKAGTRSLPVGNSMLALPSPFHLSCPIIESIGAGGGDGALAPRILRVKDRRQISYSDCPALGMPEPETDRIAPMLRRIPAVEALLRRKALQELAIRFGQRQVTESARRALENLRTRIKCEPDTEISPVLLEAEITNAVQLASDFSLRSVVNATGVVLHTNLGRAPLAMEAVKHMAEIAAQYSNLEYDLDSGDRGRRDVHTAQLFSELLGAEATLVVNNNAAAVFLALNTLAEGAEVIVSRGELVEIGGSFRIPDICAKSGAILREVGTTNRTRVSDYAAAITDRARLLLRVHPSNFRMIGFTERPAVAELAELAAERHLLLMEDLGSGCLEDLAPFGLAEEPVVSQSLEAGVDVVTFSGDKLVGGPQAGILLGRQEALARIRKNPLFRALRVDKLTIAALEATIALYLRRDFASVPAQRMIRASKEDIGVRAEPLATQLRDLPGLTVSLVDGESVAGGGSTPGQFLPSKLIAVTHERHSAQNLSAALRRNRPPIVARVEANQLLLDLRTVLDDRQEREILLAFGRITT
jgi:L-seryl-tRNA(Ser) seleniumtransferase